MAACVIAVSTLCVECITTSAPASTADRGTAETLALLSAVSVPAACTPSCCAWGAGDNPVLTAVAVAGIPGAAVCLSCRSLAKGLKWPPCASSTSKATPCLWHRSANSAGAQQQSRHDGHSKVIIKRHTGHASSQQLLEQVAARYDALSHKIDGLCLCLICMFGAYLRLWRQLHSMLVTQPAQLLRSVHVPLQHQTHAAAAVV
jgi:hypothetical protein